MEKKIKIMSIGDIHGRDSWKSHVFGSDIDYEHWRTEADNGISEFMEDQYSILFGLDKIVFIGDYVDSFTISNVDMLRNLEEIIHFKKTLPDKVVLLLGNHDIQYFIPDQICSGYRPEMRHDFEKLFRDNIDLFQICYYVESKYSSGNPWRTLWTHAGVTQGWLRSAKNSTIFNPKYRFYEEFKDMDFVRIDKFLNKLWECRANVLFNVDSSSGGFSQWGGPLWVRPSTLNFENVEGYDQIVGHTPKSHVIHFTSPDSSVESNPEKRDILTYIDCLEHGNGEVYILELSYEGTKL
jgi:hypothetical protein